MKTKHANGVYIFLLIAAGLILSAVNFSRGYAEDSDASIFIERAWHFGVKGYGPSRNWGFPLYELAAYPIIYYWGLTWAKIYSLIWYLLSGILFFRLFLFLIRDAFAAFLGALCFLVHPLAIISGNSIGESSLAIFLSLAALTGLAKYYSNQKLSAICAAAFFCGLASATRQDYLMLSGAVGVAAFFFGRKNWKFFSVSALVFLLAAAIPYLCFYGLHHFQHLNTEFLKNDSYLRTFARAVFGVLSFFGWPTLLLAGPAIFYRLWKPGSRPWNALFLFVFFLYFVRLSFNADKLEYIFGLLPVFIVSVFLSLKSKKAMLLFLLVTLLPNLLQVDLFVRRGPVTHIAAGFSPGVFAQERSERLKQEFIFLGEHKAILKNAAEKKFRCKKHITYLLDLPDPELCMIVQEERLRFWNPDRARVDIGRAMAKRVIVYPLPDHRGWRQWIQFSPWHKPRLEEFRIVSEIR